MTCCAAHSTAGLSRRRLLGALAAGGAALGVAAPGVALAGGRTEALLLTCMDYRLTSEVERYMSKRGLQHKYDHLIMAGASLGALNDKYPVWGEVFWNHLDLAMKLHDVHRLIVIDHRDCGAYKLVLGEAAVKDAEAELKAHVRQLYALRSAVVSRHPGMEVEIGLMALDGAVTQIV